MQRDFLKHTVRVEAILLYTERGARPVAKRWVYNNSRYKPQNGVGLWEPRRVAHAPLDDIRSDSVDAGHLSPLQELGYLLTSLFHVTAMASVKPASR